MRYILFIFLTMFIQTSMGQAISQWKLQNHSVIIDAYTHPNNPSQGKVAVLAIAYEKSFFRCKPSIALLSFNGTSLGSFINKKEFSRKSNKINLTINSKKFEGEGDSTLNTYTNGIEMVSYFDESAIQALNNSAIIDVSIGNNKPLISYRATNGIKNYLPAVIDSCEK
jgi:hypothetical protein